MLAAMSSREFTEWMAYYAIEGLGESPEYRADLRMGIQTATLVNLWKDKRAPAAKPEDFLPKARPEADDPVLVAEQIRAVFRGLSARQRSNPPASSPSAASGTNGDGSAGN